MHSNNGFSGAAAPAIPMITPADQSAAGRKALPAVSADQNEAGREAKPLPVASSGFEGSFTQGSVGPMHNSGDGVSKNGLGKIDKEEIARLKLLLKQYELKKIEK